MCVKSVIHQSFLTESGIATVDILVFFLSLYATIRHFYDSGGHFTDVTYFHIIHASYCVSYGLYHYLMMDFIKCACDPWNFLFVFYIVFYVLSWERFLRHWKKSTRKQGSPQEKWKLRSFIYACIVAGFAVIYTRAILKKPCDSANFYFYGEEEVWFVAYPALAIVTIDSSILAYACVCRLREFQEKFSDTTQLSEAQRQVAMFISLPLCMCLAGLDRTVVNIPYIDAEVFIFLIPSISMLMLMWKRNYIVISELQFRESLKSEISASFTSSYLPMNYGGSSSLHQSNHQLSLPKLNDDLRETLLTVEDRERETVMIDSKYRQLLNEELVFVPKLTSHIEVENVNTEHNIVFEEQLHPCPMTTSLVLEYLSNIILPLLEGMYEEHLNETRKFMRAANPDNNKCPKSVFGNCEMETQFEELTGKYDNLSHEYFDFLQMIRVVVDTLPTRVDEYFESIITKNANIATGTATAAGGESDDMLLPLKRSQLKASKVLAHMAINLNVHSTFIHEQKQSKVEKGGSIRLVRSVTFGAPASHALGWKHCGGLKESILKLQEMKALKKKDPVKFTHPEDLFDLMQLNYLALSRGSIVLSEALGGLVSSSIVTLTECLVNNELDILKQYAAIGLLVHSASLLSTSGKEECMLNDFIGAYESLNITLSFEYGKRLSRYSSNSRSPLDDDGQDDDGTVMEVSYMYESIPNKADESFPQNLAQSIPCMKRMANITVAMRVFNEKAFSKLSKLAIQNIKIVPILFNLGVNEAQSVANLSGSTLSQTLVNRSGLTKLRLYFKNFFQFWDRLNNQNNAELEDIDVTAATESAEATEERQRLLRNHRRSRHSKDGGGISSVVQSPIFDLADIPFQLDVLHHEIENEVTSKSKNVNMLLLSCFLARSMNDARTTSCKSAKDRTSVFHTLEMVKLARHWGLFTSDATSPKNSLDDYKQTKHVGFHSSNGHSDDTSLSRPMLKKEQEALDRLRGLEGVRLNNCRVNIGRAYYSFNQLQLRALPSELRPPNSTATGGKS